MKDLFAEAKNGDDYRVLKIVIHGGKWCPVSSPDPMMACQRGSRAETCVTPIAEQLIIGSFKESSRTWDQDFDFFVPPLLEDNVPCHILYRLDSTNEQGYEWLFLAWSPDSATVRTLSCGLILMSSFASLRAFFFLCFDFQLGVVTKTPDLYFNSKKHTQHLLFPDQPPQI